MIKFVYMADEHKELPRSLLVSSEKLEYCTYAWIETDEIVVQNDYQNLIPIAVIDYKPKYSRRTNFALSEPVWNWITDLRSVEEQQFIDRNIDKINELFIEFAEANGFKLRKST